MNICKIAFSNKLHIFLSLWLLSSLLLANAVCAQNFNLSKDLFEKIKVSCDKIGIGSYIYHDNYTKLSENEDTTNYFSQYVCDFEKNDSDNVVGYKLQSISKYRKLIYENYISYDIDLTNNHYNLYTIKNDSEQIYRLTNDYSVYPLFQLLLKHLRSPKKEDFKDNAVFVRSEVFMKQDCYVVELKEASKNSKRSVQNLIYISKESLLPIRSLITISNLMGKIIEKQIFDYWIEKLHIINKTTIGTFKPDISKLVLSDKNPNDNEHKSLLSIGSVAPDWTLPSIEGDSIKLSSLRGKIVILDFWFKACVPCYKQMASLEKLKEIFKGKAVEFIGVNTIDDPVQDRLKQFLDNRNITISSVYKGKLIKTAYKVYAEPCLYIIGKDGLVIFSLDGYSDNLDQGIQNIISKSL